MMMLLGLFQPRIFHDNFCTTPNESCSEELGGTAGFLCPQVAQPRSFQTPPMLKHPKKPSVPAPGWTWVLESAAAPEGAGKGLTGSVGVGTTQGA